MSIERTGFLLVAWSALSWQALHADEVRPTPAPTKWELNLKTYPIDRINVGGRNYWYLVYKVTNNTGDDVDFLPAVERVAEIDSEVPAELADTNPQAAGRMIVDPSLVGAPPAVFRAIKQRLARTHPLLVSPVEAIGRLRQGIDNSRESVAIFSELDPRVSRFTIYFGGLSGERKILPNPLYTKPEPDAHHATTQPEFFVVQKTLVLPYTLPGDPGTRRFATPVLGRIDWVMR